MLIHRWLWVAFVSSFPFSLWGLVWPTPNPAFQRGLGPEAFIQTQRAPWLRVCLAVCVMEAAGFMRDRSFPYASGSFR